VEPTELARQMAELVCRPTRDRITEDGQVRQVRGQRVADADAVVDAIRTGTATGSRDTHPSQVARSPVAPSHHL
jgi:hypothetical protein